MTAGSSVVKKTAKTALGYKWLNACVSCILFIFCVILCMQCTSFVAYVAGNIAANVLLILLAVLLINPLLLGLIRFFWRMLFSAEDAPVILFYYFSSKELYQRALKLSVTLSVRLFSYGLILFVPALIVDVFSRTYVYDLFNIPIPLWTANLIYLSVFLKSLSTVILFFVMLKYYVAPILVVADENMEVAEAIHLSVVISRRTMLDFVYLIFSFAGWIILSIFVIPLIFTLPYFIVSYAVHARFAIAGYNKHIEKTNVENYPTFVVGV